MKKIFIFLSLLLVFTFFSISNIIAEDVLNFDSTDHYLGACQLTNKAEWEQKEKVDVTTFQIWYSWNQGESTLPVTIYLNEEKFAEFEAKRNQCDPYQHQWCNADYKINKTFSEGNYRVEIPESRMCLKPGGTGTVRLYTDNGVKKEEPTPTEKVSVQKETMKVTPTVVIPVKEATNCSCSQTTIIVTAIISSIITSFFVSILMRR